MLTGADGKARGFVQLFAEAGVNVIGYAASASAFIDPHLEIDASFLAANPAATLTITPGVGNEMPAVPEPGTYALMLAGLAALALKASAIVSQPKMWGYARGLRPDHKKYSSMKTET
jgi:hypothetical protein